MQHELFRDAPPLPKDDDVLLDAYAEVGRTLDDLPGTEDFERLMARLRGGGDQRSHREVFHRLHNLRKAGLLPRLGRATTPPPQVQPEEEELLASIVVETLGALGQRDQLPYTENFESIVRRFNEQTGRSLDGHSVWRLIAKVAK